MHWVNIIIGNPIRLCLAGWILFPAMYILVSISTAFGASIDSMFLIASPLGIVGFVSWLLSLVFGINDLRKGRYFAIPLTAVILSIIPLSFIIFSMWMVSKGF